MTDSFNEWVLEYTADILFLLEHANNDVFMLVGKLLHVDIDQNFEIVDEF